jgi:hypothetical protein
MFSSLGYSLAGLRRAAHQGVVLAGDHERFFRETLRMVDVYREAGGQPTRWFVQSWYPHPKQMLPETDPHSMTALVKAVIERLARDRLFDGKRSGWVAPSLSE